MTDHEKYREQLSALLDGELDGEAREETLAHLDECEACRTYFAELTALHEALADMEDYAPPADFCEGIRARLHEESAQDRPAVKRRSAWRKWTPLAACAAVVVLTVTVVSNMRMGKSDSNSTANAPAEFALTQSAAPAGGAEEPSAMDDSALEGSLYAVPAAPAADPEGQPETTEEDATTQFTMETALNADEYAAKRAELEERSAPDLLLYGENAEYWLWNNGAWDEEKQAYWVDRETLSSLPEDLTLGDKEMLASWLLDSSKFIALVRAADQGAAG